MVNKIIRFKLFTGQQIIAVALITLISVGFMVLTAMKNLALN